MMAEKRRNASKFHKKSSRRPRGMRMVSGIAGAALISILAGCGDGTPEVIPESVIDVVEPVEVTNRPVNAEPEEQAVETGLLYGSGSLTSEAEKDVEEAMKELYRNLELPEYLGEGIHMVSSEEWMNTMSRDLYEGCRSYTLKEENSRELSVQIGLDIDGKLYLNICFQGEDGSLILLKQAEGTTWLLQTTVADGKYEGEFETWRIDSATGEILREQGTYSAGTVVGELTKSEYTGAPGEVFDLWTNRENFECKVTVETYDEQGRLTAPETPEPTATPKPATPKPNVATPAPKPAATPTPAPTPEPAPDPEPDNGDSGGDTQPDPPTPPQEPEPPASGGDTDIEWSDDLM